MQSGVVRPALAARHAGAVVAVEEDDGVVGEAVLLELVEQPPGLAVHGRDVVVILRPVLPHLRRVGMIGGHADLRGVVNQRVRPLADLALVRDHVVEDREERLPRVRGSASARLRAESSHDLAGFSRL